MIQTLNVYLNQFFSKQLVGKLALKERKIYFEYDSEFLDEGIELSPYMLPAKKQLQLCDDAVFGGLFGVFADSLPDGWGRLLLGRHLVSKGVNFKDISELERLCYVGEYGMGALTYETHLGDEQKLQDSIILNDLAQSSMRILGDDEDSNLETLLAIEGSSGGARPKIMVQIDNKNNITHSNQKLKEGYEHYIVKFPSKNDPYDVGKLEYIYSKMARDAKIDIPQTKLIEDAKEHYFAIKRFDRLQDRRVHIHSVAGLVHSDFRVPALDYDDLLKLTFALTKDFSEVVKMYRLAVFNLFVHNRDDHGKNFSFLLDENKNWKLSPAYDLTYSSGPGGEHSTTYLGEGRNPTILHLEKLAKKHSIKHYKEVIDDVKDAVSRFEIYAKELDMPKKEICNMKKII
ncbi:MAG: type II toxin-antitoxin system HipA family toxin [Campylobacterales bacterium]